MALALRFREGEEFFVGMPDGVVPVRVCELTGGSPRFSVEVEGRKYAISDELSTEILPDVKVSAGLVDATDATVKAVIDAPRSITIDRHYEAAVEKYDRKSA